MEQRLVSRTLDKVRSALEHDDVSGAITLIESLRPPDQADVFSDLARGHQRELFSQLDIADSADILEELSDEEAVELVEYLPSPALARILDEMEPDEAADLLGDLDPEHAAQLLAEMNEADDVRPLLLHPDETAGGLMTSEFLVLRVEMTAHEAIQAIRQWSPDSETAYYLFVVDRNSILSGVVNLRELIIAQPYTMLNEIMDPELISVPVDADREECAQLMRRYDLLALPVVDEYNHLEGIITIDDLVEALEEEVTEDIQRLGGAQPLARPYLSTSVVAVAKSRIGWLLLLFVTGTLTGTIMRHFEGKIENALALVFFIPLLIGTGGNAGSQTTTTVIRALAIGEIDFADAFRVFRREIATGLLLGVLMAAVAFLRAMTWGMGTPMSLTVSLSIMAIVVWATSVGSVLPIILTRLGVDPAIVSGPFMSTLVDTTGLFIYFTIAGLVLIM